MIEQFTMIGHNSKTSNVPDQLLLKDKMKAHIQLK